VVYRVIALILRTNAAAVPWLAVWFGVEVHVVKTAYK
jgi:hypothetical protein